jgi:hypothetical protein
VKDGIKNYFTRLEQARRLKKEAQERLGRLGLIETTGAGPTGPRPGRRTSGTSLRGRSTAK